MFSRVTRADFDVDVEARVLFPGDVYRAFLSLFPLFRNDGARLRADFLRNYARTVKIFSIRSVRGVLLITSEYSIILFNGRTFTLLVVRKFARAPQNAILPASVAMEFTASVRSAMRDDTVRVYRLRR